MAYRIHKSDGEPVTAAAHLRACAEAEAAGVHAIGARVRYSDHGEPREATVVNVLRYENGLLRGYTLDVEGFGPGKALIMARASEVSPVPSAVE